MYFVNQFQVHSLMKKDEGGQQPQQNDQPPQIFSLEYICYSVGKHFRELTMASDTLDSPT